MVSTTNTINCLIQETGLISIDGCLRYHDPNSKPSRVIPADMIASVVSIPLLRKLVIHLTSQGWTVDKSNNLSWNHDCKLESFIPPYIVEALNQEAPEVTHGLLSIGWRHIGPGHYLSSRGATPYLPVVPASIIDESINAIKDGAAMIHLHTRDHSDETTWHLPWTETPVKFSS